MKTIRNRIEDRFVTIPCLKGSGATHCSHKAAGNCCRKGMHKFKGNGAGRCGYVMTRAQGFSRSYNVECGDIADSPFHERTTLKNYRPHKWGAFAAPYKPVAWTSAPPVEALIDYCDDGALAAKLAHQMFESDIAAKVAAGKGCADCGALGEVLFGCNLDGCGKRFCADCLSAGHDCEAA